MHQPLTRFNKNMLVKDRRKPRVKGDNPGLASSLCACVLCASVHKSRSHTTCPLRGPDSITIIIVIIMDLGSGRGYAVSIPDIIKANHSRAPGHPAREPRPLGPGAMAAHLAQLVLLE